MGANAGKCAPAECCAADGEVNAMALSRATPTETPREEMGDPKEAMQLKVNQVLAKGPLAFRPDEDALTPAGDRTLGELADLLKPFPEMAVKITTFASSTGNTKVPQEASALKLALLRSRAVRKALKGAGCENQLAAEGMGLVDDKGARCEVSIIDAKDIERVEKKAAEFEQAEGKPVKVNWKEPMVSSLSASDQAIPANTENAEPVATTSAATAAAITVLQEEKLRSNLHRMPPSTATAADKEATKDFTLYVVFAAADGAEVPVHFTKKPLGLGFKNKTPVVVNNVIGHAKDRGVQKGWQVRSINGVGLRDKAFPEVLAFLRENSLAQQDPEVAAARLSHLRSFEINFRMRSGGEHCATITKTPLGLAYKNKMPLVITRVEGHALECGVEAGWEVLSINGESMEGKEHYEATWLLQVCLQRLKP